jgi:predicted HTH domain antitoxin
MMITLEIPEYVAHQFKNADDIRRTLYEDLIIDQRQQGKLSIGEAAELLQISYAEFFELLGQKGFSFINATPAELQESYQRFSRLMDQQQG